VWVVGDKISNLTNSIFKVNPQVVKRIVKINHSSFVSLFKWERCLWIVFFTKKSKPKIDGIRSILIKKLSPNIELIKLILYMSFPSFIVIQNG